MTCTTKKFYLFAVNKNVERRAKEKVSVVQNTFELTPSVASLTL